MSAAAFFVVVVILLFAIKTGRLSRIYAELTH